MDSNYCNTESYCCSTEWEQEIILYLDNEISPSSRSRVERHLLHCAACNHYWQELEEQEKRIAGILRHEIQADLPKEEFTDRLMQSLPEPKTSLIWYRIADWIRDGVQNLFLQGWRQTALAATLLICILGTYFTLNMSNALDERFIHIKHKNQYERCFIPAPFRVTDPNGEFFEFPDGSIIYATYETLFTVEAFQDEHHDTLVAGIGQDRQIKLGHGELYIDVRPAREGFTVRCPNARVRVFGTQFYVSNGVISKDKTVVAVREGIVMVEKVSRNRVAGSSAQLKAHQMTSVVGRGGRCYSSSRRIDPRSQSFLSFPARNAGSL